MANAKQCDRCGTFYTPKEYEKVQWKSIKNSLVDNLPVNGVAVKHDSTTIENLDLCSDCMKTFTEWIQNGKDPKKKDFVL